MPRMHAFAVCSYCAHVASPWCSRQASTTTLQSLLQTRRGQVLTCLAWLCRGGQLDSRMEHLACYCPGNLALGVHAGAVAGDRAARYLAAAEELTRTCWQMYAQMPSGGGWWPMQNRVAV